MIRLVVALPLLLGVWSCDGDESVARYGAGDTTWTLTEIDGTAYPARATLSFPGDGRIAGTGPCNRFSGEQTLPYPWFGAEAIAATRRACPGLDLETAYFAALEAMTLSEVAGDVLILRNDDGREMVFRAAAPE